MHVIIIDAACNSMPYDHELCEALVREGCSVVFFGSYYVHTDWNQDASYKRRNHFYQFTNWLYRGKPRGFLRRYVKTVEHLFNMISFLWLARKLRPDVIHVQWSQLPFIDSWFFPKLRKVAPLVYTIHNSTPLHGERPKFYFLQRINSSFYDNFDTCIAHTCYSKEIIEQNSSIPIEVIPHGLLSYYSNTDKLPYSISQKYGISSEERIILLFGNISRYKGLDILIRAFSLFSPLELKTTRLLVVGRPNLPIVPIRELAESLGVGHRIIWDLRFVSEEEVHLIISSCSIIVMPYRHIDQSGVLMTVINYGKPIVASRIGGFKEIIEDGIHGKLVNPEDPKDLASALTQILKEKQTIERMGQSVNKLANDWPTWDTIAQQTISAYEVAQVRWESR